MLTNTVEMFMGGEGVTRIERQEIPEDLLHQSTLGTACLISSTCMKLEINQ
ncbi:hypothetical protein [Desulforamulus aeronauticus]|uniref:hypothetical protein n=1 Tax=Desulforamulus aeronauticus TaxID=53343 RepID=UPI0015879EE6|nr:hypothetical protein [Desulforamulus aeronauticus]